MIAMRELNTNFVNNTSSMASSGHHDAAMVATPPLPSANAALVKRCVIIQKDEKGYGLRVSGDNPVFVESVRPDGAAWKAGVRSGDRIIKVNGTLVTKHGHGEVVRMIQNCGSYVGLTLLGLKTSSATAAAVAAAPLQITAPLPASERTQQEYEASRVATFQEMIRQEREHLDRVTGKRNQQEVDATLKRIRALEASLEKMTLDVTRHRHTSMSAENLTTGTSSESAAAANARKSHSFGQYDTRAPIMTMESDDENDDVANNNNNHKNSALAGSDIPAHVDAVHFSSLRMARWLISQNCPPHALLFYTMAGHVFPTLVGAAHTRRNLTRWAWQIACTFLVPDSPLTFHDFPSETLSHFDATLVSPNSSLDGLFAPFLEQARDTLVQQLKMWRATAIIGLAPNTLCTPKEELHATIELLVSETSPNIELAIDSMVSHAHQNNVSTIAVVTSLLTIGHYVFACPSKHLLLSHVDSSSPPPPNPILKLSDHSSSSSKKQHKRHSSCSTRAVSPGHIEAGHHFVQTHELYRVLYCSGCLLPIWGTYGHMCAHCQMSVHVWCMKNAAANYPCQAGQADNNQLSETTPTARVKKNRRWNSSRPILDILKKTGLAHTHEQQAPPVTSTSSSDDEDDDVTTAITHISTLSNASTADSISNSASPAPTIQRSESFRQRRSSRPSYRKRSDPALTTSNSTLATISTESTATFDPTSGSPVRPTTPNNSISSSDDEDDQSYAQESNKNASPAGNSSNVAPNGDDNTPPPLPPRPPSEKRRQIQMEIIESEERHVEVLGFIHKVFYRPLSREQLLTSDQLSLIFCNTKKLLKLHRNICKTLKTQNSAIEQLLVDIFCGELGLQLETEASVFCANQKVVGLDTWRARKKDSRLKNFLDPEMRTKEMPDCPLARLALDDHLGTVFQRPLRYPLLIDRLLHATPSDSLEYQLLARALARSKEIGSKVNEATRRAESKQRLLDIVRKTECDRQGLALDLEGHSLLHEGALTWRITKTKCVDVCLVLTDKLLVILTRESSDRFVLKAHKIPQSNTQHGPYLYFNDLITRDVATDTTAFFLVSSEQNFFYEFAAPTPAERKVWKEAIANATMNFNGGKTPQQHFTKLRDLTSQPSEEEVKRKDDEEAEVEPKDEKKDSEEADNNTNNNIIDDKTKPNENVSNDSSDNTKPEIPKQSTSRVEGVIRYVRDEECRAPDLISPSRVSSESINCEVAVAVLSPEQQIAEIDYRVAELLDEKRTILAKMQGINDQWEWAVVCDFAENDNINTTRREVTFFDKAMSVVSTLARDGLSREAHEPLVSLREQIDALLARLSLIEMTGEEEDVMGEQLEATYFDSDRSEDTAVYF